jgi:hypothetical protein
MSAQADSPDHRVESSSGDDHETYSQVNPLWMITVGLACFFMLILLVLSP